jgi:hypothetical protein
MRSSGTPKKLRFFGAPYLKRYMYENRHLTRELADYLSVVNERHNGIVSIWLVGSRVNGTASHLSDWDFVVFGDTTLLKALQRDEVVHRDNVDFLVVLNDGDTFEQPWGRQKRGSLSGWKWVQIDESSATYVGTKSFPDEEQIANGCDVSELRLINLRAVRVWP